jgi:hypothetical protein
MKYQLAFANLSVSTGDIKVGNFGFSFFPSFSPGGWQDVRSDVRWQAPACRFFGPGGNSEKSSSYTHLSISIDDSADV